MDFARIITSIFGLISLLLLILALLLLILWHWNGKVDGILFPGIGIVVSIPGLIIFLLILTILLVAATASFMP